MATRGRNIHLRVNVNGDSHHHDYFRISGGTNLDVFIEKVRLALLPEEISRVNDCLRDAFGARVIDLSALTDGEVLWFCPQGSKNSEASSHHKDPFFHQHHHHSDHHHHHHHHQSQQQQTGLQFAPAVPVYAQPLNPIAPMPVPTMGFSAPSQNFFATAPPDTQVHPFQLQEEDKAKPVIHWEDILIGPAIGDAFGSGISGQPAEWVSSNVDFSAFVNVKNTSDLGKYSLSTEQMIGTIRCLLEKAEETFKQGSTTSRDLFMEYWRKEENHNRSRYGSVRYGRQEGESQGGEVLVRSIPIGYMGSDIPALLVETTNATLEDLGNRPRLAAWVVAVLVEAVVIKAARRKREDIINYVIARYQKNLRNEKFSELFEDHELIEHLQKVDGIRSWQGDYSLSTEDKSLLFGAKGSVVARDVMRVVGIVAYLIKYSIPGDVLGVFRRGMSFGGDTGVIGSLILGILSGVDGLASLPSTLVDGVEDRSVLRDLAGEFKEFVMNWQ